MILERVAADKKAHVWARDTLDFYVEPVRATEALLSVERFVGNIWDLTAPRGEPRLGWLGKAASR